MKTDARVRYTRRMLKSALIKKLAEKPINRITVKEVCEEAQVNRATFYTHYFDCYDLLEQIENDLLSDFSDALKYLKSFDVTDLINAIFVMIENNIELCRTVIFKNPNAAIIKKMINLTHDNTIAYWRTQLHKANEAELEMLFCCLANGLMSVVVEGYEKYEKQELIGFVSSQVKNSLQAFI